MKYTLNKLDSNVRTTNNFKINDITVDLDLPDTYSFHDFKSNYPIESTVIDKEITSRIGLTFNKYLNIDINIDNSKDDIILEYDFSGNDNLAVNFNINYLDNSNGNIIIKFKSLDNNKHICFYKENLINKENSNGNITIINMLNDNSYMFTSILNSVLDNSNITHNIIDIGGSIRISNIFGKTYKYANNIFNNIYIGLGNSTIDSYYYLDNIGNNSFNNLVVEGVLNDNSNKNFRGIIDLESGASSSRGIEGENCILLSDRCRSRSLPVLLCGEENVEGAHGVSTGKIDQDKLFYIMSRGYNKKEAEKLIVMSRFNNILNNISNEEIRSELYEYIENLLTK